MDALTMLATWGSAEDPEVLAVCAAGMLLAVIAETLGMRAMPPGSHGRAHLDERPVLNRAAVIVCALIAPWPVLRNLMREG
jgi:hypothetical protein